MVSILLGDSYEYLLVKLLCGKVVVGYHLPLLLSLTDILKSKVVQ